jgi:uncharacterized protein YbaP (TraB family)
VKSGAHTIYLLAMLNHTSPAMYPLPRHIEDTFRSSSTLLVETDLAKMDRNTVVASAAEGIYPSSDSLWNHFSPETKTLIAKFCAVHDRFCTAHELTPQALSKWQPWMAALFALNIPDLLAGVPIDSEMDRYFQTRAKGHLRIREIDGLPTQLDRVKQVPASQLEEFVAGAFRAADRAAAERQQDIEQLQALWLSGEMEEVEAIVARRLMNGSDFERRILQDGQMHMAEAISQWIERSDRCFAVIDLDWMVGADGLLRRLQQAGFQVQQVLHQ